MEPTDQMPGSNNKVKLIIIALVVLIILAGISILLLNTSKKSSITATPSPSPSPIATVPNTTFPKSYGTTPIPKTLFTQIKATTNNENESVNEYIKKYYIFKDVLTENKITFPTTDENSLDAISKATPILYQLVVDNLVSKYDFAYIKARFRLYPTDDIEVQVNKDVPNLQAKAKELIEKYRTKFSSNIVNIQQIVNEANNDPELTQINIDDKNEFIRNYTPAQNLFYTDPNFSAFVYAQKRGQVSPIYELKQDNKAYAYIIIYPASITVKKYNSVDEIVKLKSPNFQ